MHTKKEPRKKLIKNQVRKVVLLTEKRLCSKRRKRTLSIKELSNIRKCACFFPLTMCICSTFAKNKEKTQRQRIDYEKGETRNECCMRNGISMSDMHCCFSEIAFNFWMFFKAIYG